LKTKNNKDITQGNPPLEQVFIVVEQLVSNIYHVHLDEDIEDMPYYRNVISVLNNASPDDVVVFHISSVGGHVDTAVNICNAIRSTEAQTISVIETYAISAASLFVMSTDSVIAMPHSYMMIHPASYGYVEDMKKLRKFVEFHDKRLMEIMHDFYEGFLSKEEIESTVEHSMEIWLTADEVIERLTNRDEQLAVLADGDEDIDDIIQEITESPKRKRGKKND
jgi:ATP-dependent protease ClpP protease subunit